MCPVEATESSQQFPIARYDYLRLTSEENCVVSTSKFPRTFAACKNDWTQMILEHRWFIFFLFKARLTGLSPAEWRQLSGHRGLTRMQAHSHLSGNSL